MDKKTAYGVEDFGFKNEVPKLVEYKVKKVTNKLVFFEGRPPAYGFSSQAPVGDVAFTREDAVARYQARWERAKKAAAMTLDQAEQRLNAAKGLS